MKITSKYSGRCDLCGDSYEVGDEIQWKQGEPVSHWSCYESDRLNAASEIKPAQKGVTVTKTPVPSVSEQTQSMTFGQHPIIQTQFMAIIRVVLNHVRDQIKIDSTCVKSIGESCDCAKCQVDRMDEAEIAQKLFGVKKT